MKPETPKQRGPIQHTEAFQNASPEAQARALRMQQLSRHAEMRDEYVQTRERVRKAEQHYSALKTEVRRRIDANTSPEDTAHWQKQLVTLEAKYAQLQSLKPAQIHVQPGAPENMGDVSEKEAWLAAWNRIATELEMVTIQEPLKAPVAPAAAPVPTVAPAIVTVPPLAPSAPPVASPKASTPKPAPRSAYDPRSAAKPVPAPKGLDPLSEPKLKLAEPETKERQAALEQFRKGLHFPQTVGTYPSERFTLEKETDRALCEKDLHALLGAAKGESVERYARKGENFPFGADPKALVRSSEIRYAGEAFTLRSSWRALDDGKSLVKLTIDNAQPGLLMHFDAKGTLTEVTQLRDPFNVWGQIATEKKLEMGRYCKPGKKELQEYYGVRSESERKEKNPPKYDVSKKEDVQKIVFVPTGQALVANLSTPLATDCLWICTGLSVIDPVGKRHMLAHVNGGADATGVGGVDKDALKNAEKALEGFAMATCQVTLAIGDSEENIARELFELLRNKYGVSADRIRIVPPRVIDRGGSHRGEDILCAPGEKTPIFRAMEWSNREGNPVYHHLREQQKSSYEAKAVPAPKDSEPAPAKPDGKADALKTPEEKIFDFNSIESDASFEIVPGAKIKLTEGVSIERNGNKLTFVLGKEWNQDGMLYRHGGTPEGGKPWVKDYAQAFEKYDWLERISFLKVSPEFGKFSIEAMNKTIPSKESMYAIKQGDSLLLSIGENRLRVRTTRPDGLLILAEGSALMAYFGKAKK